MTERFKSSEEGWVQSVRQCGSTSNSIPVKININYTVQVSFSCLFFFR